jgi:lipopolysaccharide/colanic/teichoic acid biosynthesis glycosyltransferase
MKNDGFIGNINRINDIINIYNIDEVIFCAKDIPAQKIIDKMSELSATETEFKIAPPESLSIIGSQSINTSGDIYIIELDSISKLNNKRSKRFLDIVISLLFLPLYPVLLFVMKRPFGFLKNIFLVLSGRKSWVGYDREHTSDMQILPKIKPGVLTPSDVIKNTEISPDTYERLNLLYARDYKVINDLNIIWKGFRKLGRQ